MQFVIGMYAINSQRFMFDSFIKTSHGELHWLAKNISSVVILIEVIEIQLTLLLKVLLSVAVYTNKSFPFSWAKRRE